MTTRVLYRAAKLVARTASAPRVTSALFSLGLQPVGAWTFVVLASLRISEKERRNTLRLRIRFLLLIHPCLPCTMLILSRLWAHHLVHLISRPTSR